MKGDLAKRQFKTPAQYKRFKRLVSETKVYDVPASLKGELRPYQKIGYSWLVQNITFKFLFFTSFLNILMNNECSEISEDMLMINE